jgi:hypothetical protein
MPRVALLIAASPTAAFYSQIAALNLAVRRLRWSRWEPSIHVYIGGPQDPDCYAEWQRHLADVDVWRVSGTRFAQEGDWAQSDDAFRFAPRDADVLLALDADTFPVESLEDQLDRIVETNAVAGVIAHYPTVLAHTWDERTLTFSVRHGDAGFPDVSSRAAWERMSQGLIDPPLNYGYFHTLTDPGRPLDERQAPFYLNFGVVFFSRSAFEKVALRYLDLRPRLRDRMPYPDFSGQAALTLAIAAAGVTACALPMRYNFPNDPVAERLYPEELVNVVVFHYLRTTHFDRHRIFTDAKEYSKFLSLPLTGVDSAFQQSVKWIVGSVYPFA